LPVFDDQPSLDRRPRGRVAPTDLRRTGESTLRDSTGFGNGVYKSTDAGPPGPPRLSETQHIGKIAVDPKTPTVFFAAMATLCR